MIVLSPAGVKDMGKKQYLTLSAQGSLLEVKYSHQREQMRTQSRRGRVVAFSKASRRRLIKLCARLSVRRGTFITLTYPDTYPDEMTAKAHLRALLERIRRRFPKASAVWRMEYQERGAPHFHLIFANLPYLPFEELRKWWGEIIRHNAPFVRIELVRTKRGIMSYCSKYIAKVATSDTLFNYDPYRHAGRFWGVFNGKNLPYDDLVEMVLEIVSPRSLWQVKRALRHIYPRFNKSRYAGGFLLRKTAYALILNLMKIASQEQT